MSPSRAATVPPYPKGDIPANAGRAIWVGSVDVVTGDGADVPPPTGAGAPFGWPVGAGTVPGMATMFGDVARGAVALVEGAGVEDVVVGAD